MLKFIVGTPLYKRMTVWSKSVHFRDKDVSLYLISVIFLQKLKNNDIGIKSSAVAFNFTLAIFPAIIFLFTLLPYMPIYDLKVQVYSFFNNIAPNSIHSSIRDTIEDIMSQQRNDLLSFGFISAIYLASNGMSALIDAFDSCYHGKIRQRSFITKKLVATLLTLLLAFILILAIIALVAGQLILDTLVSYHLLAQDYLYHLINVLRYIVVGAMFFGGTSFIYYLAPSIPHRWSFMSAGAIIASALSVGFSWLFSFYLDNFSNYNTIYGSIGAMVGVMLWLSAIAYVLLIGFELNASLELALQKKGNRDEEGDAPRRE